MIKRLIHFFFTLTFLTMTQLSFANSPHLIDRETFFGNPEIAGGQISPDGQWISFTKAYHGIMNIWVKKFDESFDQARPLTDSKRPLAGYFWTDDSKYIVYIKDHDGDENYNIYAVNPQENSQQPKDLPKSRNLTPLKEVNANILMVSKKDPDIMMIGLNDRDKAWHDLYKLHISTGKLEKIYENHDRITDYDFDWNENLRILARTDEQGNTTFLRVDDGDKLTPIYQISVTENAYISGWDETNSRFYLVTNKGDLNLTTLFLVDPYTQKMEKIESDPNQKVDFGGLKLDRNTHKPLFTQYTLDKTQYYWKDAKWQAMYQFLQQHFAGREVTFTSSNKDYSKFLVAVDGDRYAAETYFYDPKQQKLIYQYTPRPKLKKVEANLASMQAIHYPSSDGLDIPAYLTLPVGQGDKNLPLVVLVHGGPKGPRDTWGYNSFVQFLANRGYAVLQPNYRASGGFGKHFLNAGDLQWGKLMQDDITWGVKYLIQQGIANPSKIAIMGGSYGGYATLAGLAFTPELYACGVDIVGPSNIFTLLDSIPPYWESGRAFLYGMVGDPNTEQGKQRIREASPLFSADKIQKPLLIVQGANDPRVKKAEADQIVIALRDKGMKVDYLLANDEGHGFAKPVNNMAMFAEIEKFLASILGGRYQESMSDEVAQRLQQLRVDISQVKYQATQKLDIAKTLPTIQNTFQTSTNRFNIQIAIADQSLQLKGERQISQQGANWRVQEISSGATGQVTETALYTSDFKLLEQHIEQEGMKISVHYQDHSAMLDINGKKSTIALDGAYINNAPAYDLIISGLPLAPGYQLNFQQFDPMTAKVSIVQLSVAETETLHGKSYTKVLINNPENNATTTLWIDPKEKYAEKIESNRPELGNAKFTVTRQ